MRRVYVEFCYDLFEEEDFEQFKGKVTEWLKADPSWFEKDPWDVWNSCRDEFYFRDSLEDYTNDPEYILSDRTKDSFYEDAYEAQLTSEDGLYNEFKELFEKIKRSNKKTIDNE